MQRTFGAFVIIGGMTMMIFLVLAVLLGGCTPPPLGPVIYPPQEATVYLRSTPDDAYQHAYRTFSKMPTATITNADPKARAFLGELHNAVRMSVIVEPQEKHARVTIVGSVMPNKLVTGEFTEVQDFAHRLEQGGKR